MFTSITAVTIANGSENTETLKFWSKKNFIKNKIVGITVAAARSAFKRNDPVKKNNLNCFSL